MTPEARRALGGGFALAALSTATAMSTNSARHGLLLGAGMLLTALAIAAIVQHGSRHKSPPA
jgi:hypothetical protein